MLRKKLSNNIFKIIVFGLYLSGALIVYGGLNTSKVLAAQNCSATVTTDCIDGTSYRCPSGHTIPMAQGSTCPAVCSDTVTTSCYEGTEYYCSDGHKIPSGIAPAGCSGTISPAGGTAVAGGDEVLETDCGEEELNEGNCQIIKYIVTAINFLSALAVLSIIASMIMAGYMYMTARDNSGQIEKAKTRIYWAIAALGVFLFTFTFLNWLVPGGVL